MLSTKKYLSGLCVPVYVTAALFAMSSWIDIYGMWAEMPILIDILPEGWRLASFMSIIEQIANVGPLAYLLMIKLTKNKNTKEWYFIYVIIGVGCAASFLLAFFWEQTSVVNGQEHSVTLFVLTGFLAPVDCTSSVVFLPYMSMFKEQYMSAYFLGDEFGGFITGMVGLVQGTGLPPECVNMTIMEANVSYNVYKPVYKPPRFSVQTYMFFLFGLLCVSGLSFTLLHFCPYCRRQRRDVSRQPPGRENNVIVVREGQYVDEPNEECESNIASLTTGQTKTDSDKERQRLTPGLFAFSLAVLGWTSVLVYGSLPSIEPYAALPYGNRAYTLITRLQGAMNLFACLLGLCIRVRSKTVISSLTVVATTMTIFHVYLAAVSPYPPLKGTAIGKAIVVTTGIMIGPCAAYVRVVVMVLMSNFGHGPVMLCGVVMQAGSAVGSVTAFLVINVFNLLESMPPCP